MTTYRNTACLLCFCLSITLGQITLASQISRLSLQQLASSSQYVVLGQIEKIIASDEWSDTVKVKVEAIIKGGFHSTGYLEIKLSNRGAKDFDPILSPGENAVFFLKEVKGWQATLANPGSIATFPKDNFKITQLEPH